MKSKKPGPVTSMESPHPTREFNCQLCSCADADDNMVACDVCENWFHYRCVGVDSFIADQEFTCEVCANAAQLPKGHSTPTSLHIATTMSMETIGIGSDPSISSRAVSTKTGPIVKQVAQLPPVMKTAQSSREPVLDTCLADGDPLTVVHQSITQPLTSCLSGRTTESSKRTSVFIDVSSSKSQIYNTHEPNLTTVAARTFRSSQTHEDTIQQLSFDPVRQFHVESPVIGSNVRSVAGGKVQVVKSKQSGEARAVSLTSKKGSSKSSKSSASARRVKFELRKLEEEKALEKEFLNRKYQILSEIAEDTSGSEDDNDNISTDTNSKVEDWLKDTRTSEIPKQGECKAVAVSLDPKGHGLNLSHTWPGANVDSQLPPQPRPLQLSSNPWYQPITVSTQAQAHAPALTAYSSLPTNGLDQQRAETANIHRKSSLCDYQRHKSSTTPIEHQSSTKKVTSKQIAARHSILKDLQTFSGNPEEWPLFICNFNRTTELCGFSDEENLLRLQKVLKDKAKEAVQSMMYNPSCVPRILAVLEMLFGKPDKILNALTTKIQMTPSPKADKLDTLIEFAVAVQNHCAALEASGLSAHLNNSTLLQELIAKLPVSIQLNWAIYSQTLPVCTLSEFSVWMYRIAEAANRITPMTSKVSTSATGAKAGLQGKKERVFLHTHLETKESTTSSGPHSAQRIKERRCVVCSKNCPSLDSCLQFRGLSFSAKWEAVRNFKLCRCCLKRHSGFRCRLATQCGIDGCTYKHHQLLHNAQSNPDKQKQASNPVSPIIAQPSNAHMQNSTAIMYRIVPVILHGNKVQIQTYAFLDDGSSLTLMDEDIATQLNITGTPDPLCIRWTANTHRYEGDSRMMSFSISGAGKKGKIFPINNVHTVKSLQLPLQSLDAVKLQEQYRHLRDLPIESYSNASPRILIGLNNWRLGLTQKCKEGNIEEPVAAKTRLGWTVYGCCPRQESEASLENSNAHVNFHECECCGESEYKLEQLVHDYLCNENFGSSNSKTLQSIDDQRALEQLEKYTRRKGSRFETGLLWKNEQVQLPSSYSMAKRRLLCLQQKMSRDLHLAEELHNKIESYVEKGYAKKLSPNEVTENRRNSWYLPIFPVRNINKPGKIRLVWDAAAKVSGVSLNSVLLKGPDLLTSLVSVLLQFRERSFAICADIQEMFHRILIRKEDQNYQRFLWFNRDSKEVEEYIMLVMTFGATCSPCSAQFIKNKNAEEFENIYPRAVKSIRKNHYVDDLMDSVDSEEEAVKLAKEVTFIHQQGGFHIRNWISNSKAISESFQCSSPAEVSLNSKTELSPEKVLGMWWCTTEDCLTFKISANLLNTDVLRGSKAPTKREVLRTLMKVFDPLGLLANFLMYGKILLQEIWRSGIGWDVPIQEAEYKKWLHWISFLPKLEEVRIPRCYISKRFAFYPDFELHVFVDASENGFAAAAYARMTASDLVECTLIGAKTKVAPLKSLSIPRLELQAAVLGTRLAKMMSTYHSISFKKQVFWSDSRTVLSWLRSDHRRYRQFVACRVSEILETTDVNEWRWVPTKTNVADEATKWHKGPNLESSSAWFRGPAFLTSPSECWPKEERLETNTDEELKAQFVGLHCIISHHLFQPERFSHWFRLLRFASRVIRNAINWKLIHQRQPRRVGALTSEELQQAERVLLKQAQYDAFAEEIATISSEGKINKTSSIISLCPYLDDFGVLRANNRIKTHMELLAEFSRPMILPTQHRITTLLVEHYHLLYHHQNHETVVNEIRQKFVIARLRAVLSSVRRNCQACKNATAQPQPPMMSQLPAARTSAFSRPFSFTGVDYFGPMLIVNLRRTEKRYGVLLTCLTTRAIHIEIAHSLTTDSCILAIRNFMARRGTPIELFSDNGTNFRGAATELKQAYQRIDRDKLTQTFTSVNTKWTFITPGSPHMGGSWERLVRSVKTVLNQISPSRTPSDELLRSMLLEVENIVNSRPLTYIPIANENEEALTPNHFLLGSSNGSKPWAVFNNEKEVLRKNWLVSQLYAQHFWQRWVKEYLPTITRRTKWFQPVKPIEKDDIVLIVDPASPRNCWPKGRVIDTKVSADGQVRSATVLTKTGTYERPAVKLAVLEVRKDNKVGPPVDIPGGGVAHAELQLNNEESQNSY